MKEPAAEPLPATALKPQTKAIVIGLLTLPLFGVGLLVFASILFTKTRSAPCPHCTGIVRLRDGERVRHEDCGKWSERRGELVYAA